MICVTGNERRLDDVAARIDAHPEWLHELRADALEHIDDALFELCARHGPRLVFCCRAAGLFHGSEEARVALLLRAQARGVRYVDVEDGVPLERFDRARVALSHHDFAGSAGLPARAAALAAAGTAVVKLAAHVDDAAELATLLEARRRIPQRAVVVGMGAAGILSRARYGAFGSEWSYVIPSRELATAPGQLTVAEALALGLPGGARDPFCGLAGGPQVLASPGARVYNALFRERGVAMGYVPLVTASLARALPLFEAVGARGLSVTMPLKAEAFALCRPDAIARDVGAVNSLRRGPDGWEGTNTDVIGVREPLRAAGARGTALVLGAGGAARAALRACRDLGLEVAVSARQPRGVAGTIAWEARTTVAHDVLINATPLASPWPDEAPLAPLVFDLALGHAGGLAARARGEGARALDPLEMWVHQGAAQLAWMTGERVTAAELRAKLPSEGAAR
jgi:3-dehydroquinate dehydratase type I